MPVGNTIGKSIKKNEYVIKANQAEQKYGLPENMLVGLIQTESRFNPNAVSPAGAIGIAQFMPGTARDFGIDPRNVDQSIDAAGKYLSQNYKKLGNWDDTLRSYNMGLGNVNKWKQGRMRLPKETAEYVGKVYANMGADGGAYIPQNSTYYNNRSALDDYYLPPDLRPGSENTGVDLPEAEDTEEVAAAKKEIDKATTEKQILQDYLTQSQVPQQVAQQEQEPQQELAPSIGEQYQQVSQIVDNPISQEGGNIPVSSRGVYDYPEQNVIVPTEDGKITMDKVPYPILGVDNLGYKQMMYPGRNYEFPGEIIYEMPQIKKYLKYQKGRVA